MIISDDAIYKADRLTSYVMLEHIWIQDIKRITYKVLKFRITEKRFEGSAIEGLSPRYLWNDDTVVYESLYKADLLTYEVISFKYLKIIIQSDVQQYAEI